MAGMQQVDSIGTMHDPNRWMVGSVTMKLSGIDANLLAALDALLREKSVTRAARRLGVGQPALSHSLSRLRAHFKDELLVLKGRTFVLTDKADKLASVVANATRALSEVFEEHPSFDAATSSYRFVVACSDLFGILVVPELLRTLRRDAGHVEVELRAIVATSKESILEGGVDLALGIFEDLPASINQQSLYDDPAVCVVRANHEQVGKRLTLETYSKLPHMEIGPIADAIPGLRIDRALAAIGKRRHVTLRIPYYLLAPHILEHSDHVATLSASGADILVKMARLRVVEPPIALPSYRYSQIWNNRHNDDRAHTWLRDRIAGICQSRGLALAAI
jgi:DNA-binding transcriptional LysR family regulator